jgi:hypothetical protein
MSETGRPGRYTRSTSGLVGAMLILFVAVVGFVVFRGLFRTEPEYTPPDTDYVEVVRAVQGEGGDLVYPEDLPEGWVVNNLDYLPGLPPTFSLALLTDEEEFAGMIDTGTEPDELVEAYVDEVAVEGDPFVLEASEVATEWRTFTDDGGDTAYVAEIDLDPATADAAGEDATRTVMVYGSADPEVLQDLLASLTTAPLR